MSLQLNRLQSNGFTIDVCPELGGSIANLTFQGKPLLRPWNGDPTVRRMACYPLIPFSNRIADGCFNVNGKSYQLHKNFGDHPHPLHGVGWQHSWEYQSLSTNEALLLLDYHTTNPHIWPFAFIAKQHIQILSDTVRVEMLFTNMAETAVPVGLGWHPFFSRHQQAILQTQVRQVWLNNDRSLPEQQTAVPQLWDFSVAKEINHIGVDNCFSGWSQRATIHWPTEQYGVVMTASHDLTHLVLFTPPEPADFFAVEPVSHASNAINFSQPEQHGLQFVEPQQTIHAWIAFTPLRSQV